MESQKKVSFISLLVGLLLIAVGVMIFLNPSATFQTLSLFLGVLALLRGLMLIVSYVRLKELADIRVRFSLAAGLLLVLAGLVLCLYPALLGTLLGYLVAAWFIVDAASSLFRLSLIRSYGSTLSTLTVLLNVLLLAGGIALLFNPMIVGWLTSAIVGLSLIASGIQCAIAAFLTRSRQ